MSAFIRLHRVTLSLVALSVLLVLPGGALAAKGRVGHFDEVYVDDFSFPSCDGSYTIDYHSEGRYHEIDYFDPAAGLDANGDAILTQVKHNDVGGGTYTNPATGKSLSFSYSDHFDETAVSYNGAVPYPDADSGVGVSYTLLWQERGIPIKIKLPTGRVISVDAGLITTPGVEIVVYYVAGEQRVDVLALGDPVVHGPHPLFRTDRFCQITDQYLK
jgi:hypothetical protein